MSGFGGNNWKNDMRPDSGIPSLFAMPMYGQQSFPHMASQHPTDAAYHRPRFSFPPPATGSVNYFNPAEQWHSQHQVRPPHPEITVPAPRAIATAEDTVKVWLAKNGLQRSSAGPTSGDEVQLSLTLLDVKIMLHRLNILRLKLTQVTDSKMGNHVQEKSVDIQGEVKSLLSVLEDPGTKEMVRCKLMRAQKRKARRDRQRQKLWEEQEAKSRQEEEAQKRVDKWFDEIQEQKRTEQMRKAADESMSGVRQKINDVVRQKDLISALDKLRSIRKKSLSSGQGGGHQSSKRFTRRTNVLLKLLNRRLELYRKEETALKVMLETEQEESLAKLARIEATRELRRHEKEERRKELWLFGSQEVSAEVKPFYEYYTQADKDFDSFLGIRREWDRYIIPENTPGSSNIPKGWVIPSEPYSESLARYLITPEGGGTSESCPILKTD